MSNDRDDLTPAELERLKTLYEVSVPLTVGRATISWNTLSGAFFDVFLLLSGMSEEAAQGVFFAVASDRSQRDMASNLIERKLAPLHRAVAKRGQKLIGDANGLAGKRNDILHVVYDEVLNPAVVRQRVERGHLKGKSGADLLDAIHAFAMRALNLAIEVGEFRADAWAATNPLNSLVGELPLPHAARSLAEEVANRGEYSLLGDRSTTQSLQLPDHEAE